MHKLKCFKAGRNWWFLQSVFQAKWQRNHWVNLQMEKINTLVIDWNTLTLTDINTLGNLRTYTIINLIWYKKAKENSFGWVGVSQKLCFLVSFFAFFVQIWVFTLFLWNTSRKKEVNIDITYGYFCWTFSKINCNRHECPDIAIWWTYRLMKFAWKYTIMNGQPLVRSWFISYRVVSRNMNGHQ